MVEDLLAGCAPETVALRFHRTMAEFVVECCVQLRRPDGPEAVALSGGTFQNMLLLTQVEELLARRGFRVYRHRRVPPNDGGLALGQAVLADRME